VASPLQSGRPVISSRPPFTVCLGSSLQVRHGPSDGALQAHDYGCPITSDQRQRFKESYAPPLPHTYHKKRRADTCHKKRRANAPRLAENDVVTCVLMDSTSSLERQQVLIELSEAKAEVRQLRNALRASTLALQRASAVLPAETIKDIEAHNVLIQSLMDQLKDRDDQIAVLNQRCSKHEESMSAHLRVVLNCVASWAGHGREHTLHEVWGAWHKLAKERHLAKDFERAIESAKSSVQPTVSRFAAELSSYSSSCELRMVIARWRAVVHSVKQDAVRERRYQDKARLVLLRWMGGSSKAAIAMCWSGWQAFCDDAHQSKRLAAQQAEHLRVATQLRKQVALKSAVALAESRDESLCPYLGRAALRLWRECMLEERAHKALQREQELSIACEERSKARAIRNFMLLMVEGSKPKLLLAFNAWREQMLAVLQERETSRLHWLRAMYVAWRAISTTNRRERELDRLRKKQEKDMNDHEAQLMQDGRKRGGLFALATSGSKSQGVSDALQQVMLSAWHGAAAEMRHERDMEQQKKKWELEWGEHEAQMQMQQRHKLRSGFMAFASITSGSEQHNAMLLKSVWSCWSSAAADARRDKMLDDSQRVFEDSSRRSLEEKQKLLAEAKILDECNHSLHQQRKVLFLMSVGGKDLLMLLQVAWSAWRECMLDTRERAVQDLRVKLVEITQQNNELKNMTKQNDEMAKRKEEEIARRQEERTRKMEEAAKQQAEAQSDGSPSHISRVSSCSPTSSMLVHSDKRLGHTPSFCSYLCARICKLILCGKWKHSVESPKLASGWTHEPSAPKVNTGACNPPPIRASSKPSARVEPSN